MRRAARRDENEKPIVDALEAAGYSVFRLSQDGIPDLLVGKHKQCWLLEVLGDEKVAKYRKTGGLTPAQVKFWERWKGPASCVRSIEEAFAVVGS